ncbi:solute carrier family 25 member 32-like [Bolinopsis microptera]|uniref:solute carrier family 25 member 32-like n=1 Tax=Bolinopsis microptera TaxID=2820187 RepID=UPI00307AED58
MSSIESSWFKSIVKALNFDVLIAGLTGGAVSTLILHPLDVVKIQLQVSENHSYHERKVYKNMRDVIPTVYRNGGLLSFYQGVSPNLVGAACSWGLYFFIYHGLKTSTLQNSDKTSLGMAEHLAYAAIAGFMTLTLTNPIWVIKTRMVLQASSKNTMYRGLVDGLSQVARKEGLRGLYSGYLPGLFGISHGVIQFVSYEKMKEYYYKKNSYNLDEKLGVFPYIALSASSKVLAVSLTYPYQVIRSRLQDASCQYNGSWDIIMRTVRNEGWRGFYKGIVPNLIRVTPACCITFVCFENVMHYLKAYKTI